MTYITFFQFLRRCFLWDAERYIPPDTVVKNVETMLGDRAGGEDAKMRAERTESPGIPGGIGKKKPEQGP